MKKLSFIVLSLLLSGIIPSLFSGAQAQSDRPDISDDEFVPADFQINLEPVLSGLSSPLFITNAHDGTGRLFVVEQPGRIKVLQPGASQPTVFLDISNRVLAGGERGLLGLTFHPQFRNNHRFFVDYTRQPDGATVIAEYQVSAADPNVASTTERVILTIAQPFANHNGGMVEFGPDGFLYIGMGDGGSANDPGNRAQNLNELLGKILRIDIDHADGATPYSSPADNPFFGSTTARHEIYAYGLRNPWRFSFERNTGELMAGDVGQDVVEEIDQITKGGNYGWRVLEGTRCTGNGPASCTSSGFIPPIAEYTHASGRCSIIGGYVYRGTKGTFRQNHYVYGDYCTGEIFVLDGTTQEFLLDTSMQISSFGEDEAGEIYVAGINTGTVQRLVNPHPFTGPTGPPSDDFQIQSPLVRKITSGKVFNPVTTTAKGKKYELILEAGPIDALAKNAGAVVLIDGVEMNTESVANDTGTKALLITRLRRGTLSQPGTLTIQARRADGTFSNQITLQVVPAT